MTDNTSDDDDHNDYLKANIMCIMGNGEFASKAWSIKCEISPEFPSLEENTCGSTTDRRRGSIESPASAASIDNTILEILAPKKTIKSLTER